MPTLIPDTNAAYDGTNTEVTVALLAAAECPHGHNIAYVIPDLEDADYYQQKATAWAIGHANECTGAKKATLKAA